MTNVRKINLVLVLVLVALFSFNPGREVLIREIPPLERIRYGAEAGSYPSKLLSEFWKHSVAIRAAVLLPRSYKFEPARKYPVVFHFPGFGGDESEAFDSADAIHALEAQRPELEMVHVFMRASYHEYYHSFVDSECGGPWGSAFIKDFLPQLEARYRLTPNPRQRFLTGHSSGAWTAVWLQVRYPKDFGGAWASSPDPLDFRNFFGIDVTVGSKDNVYVDSKGNLRPYSRRMSDGSLQSMVQPNDDNESEDSEFESDEWKWSSCDEHGIPYPLFDRRTGRLQAKTQLVWEQYDLRRVVEKRWPEIGPDLRGKLHIVCGERDTFFLEAPTHLFCDSLEHLGERGSCMFVPGRNHQNLYNPAPEYPEGLFVYFMEQMAGR